MNPSPSRTPKVREFVNPPFVRCPECGNEGKFGVLMICDRHYIRRCVHCWFDKRLPLPAIAKRVVYLDQFVISNIMKELDPDRSPDAKGRIDGFYRSLFEILDRLLKLQLIACPDSPRQDNESVVDTRYEKIRSVFRHLSHGVTFKDPEHLLYSQILRAFESWLVGKKQVSIPSRGFALTKNPDVWTDHIRIDMNFHFPGFGTALTSRNAAITKSFQEASEYWKSVPKFRFEDVFDVQVRGCAKDILEEFFGYTQRMASAVRSGGPFDQNLAFPPHAVELVTLMLKMLKPSEPDTEKQLKQIGAFFRSDNFREVPAVRIGALFWATIAREIHGGRGAKRFPKAGMLNDIDVVATYSPYCDAMFVDRELAHFASQRELREELKGGSRIFSLREKKAFLEYLHAVETEASKDHLQLVEEVYGSDWATPFTDLLSMEKRRRS